MPRFVVSELGLYRVLRPVYSNLREFSELDVTYTCQNCFASLMKRSLKQRISCLAEMVKSSKSLLSPHKLYNKLAPVTDV